MAYQALYRQWRPRKFSQMVGQEPVVETLRHQVQTGRIAHAYLFCGSRGTGKTSTAKILARAINCLNPQDGDVCGECEMCRRMQDEDFLDILEYDAASNSKVENARELLNGAQFPPQAGKYKVYIIDEVHMMSDSAFNALLKTLEEPPEYLVFILATTEPFKLPSTILSRCQRFDFGRIPAAQIAGRLREAVDGQGASATDGALMAIARAAEGGMRDALSILDMCLGYGRAVDEKLVQSVLGTSDRSFLFRFSEALKEEKAGETFRLIDELMNAGKDPQAFIRDLGAHLRTLLLAKFGGKAAVETLGLSLDDGADYVRQSEDFPASRLMDMLDQFMRLESGLRYAGTPRIALENVCLKCCLRTKEPDTLALQDQISALEHKIEQLEEKLAGGTLVPAAPAAERTGKKTQAEKPGGEAKPAKQKETPAAVGKNPEEIWQAALKNLHLSDPGMHGFFQLGKFIGAEGSEYRWQAGPGQEFIATSLNTPARKQKVEEALTAAAGVPCSFTALDSTRAETAKAEKNEGELVDELRQTFGAEAVTVVE